MLTNKNEKNIHFGCKVTTVDIFILILFESFILNFRFKGWNQISLPLYMLFFLYNCAGKNTMVIIDHYKMVN